MRGQFAWYELTTSDTEAAQKFYKTFTGWNSRPFDADYTVMTLGDEGVAGIFKLTEELRAQGVPPNWMPYVEPGDIAETCKLATSLGATIMHGPVSIPNVGDIAVIQDPQSAVFGLYKSSSGAPSWDGTPVVGKFSWTELMTTDHTKAFEFYRRLFGWEKISEMDMGDGLMYLIFGKGEAMYGGMFTTPSEMANMHPFWLCYINVKDVPKSLATATKNGASVHRPPMDIPGGVIAILGDPQGAGFALHHLSGDVSASASASASVSASATKGVKSAAKKAPARTAAAKKAPAKKAAVKKVLAKKKSASKKTAPKKTAKKQAARKPARAKAKKSPARKKSGAKKKK